MKLDLNRTINNKIYKALSILVLTRKYFRAKQIPDGDCTYYINGKPLTISGEHILSMLMEIVMRDEYCIKEFNSPKTIVDIGANIGVFSLYASSIFPEANIWAYEPSSKAMSFLRSNLKKNNIEVNLFPFAVGLEGRDVELYNETGLTCGSIAYPDHNIVSKNTEKCKMISFEEVANRVGKTIDLLKLDCEGSEYEIFKADALSSCRSIVGELHTCTLGEPQLGFNILYERGFHIKTWKEFPDGKAGIFHAVNQTIPSHDN